MAEQENKSGTKSEKAWMSFYHPNPKGTGSAIKFALFPATAERAGLIGLQLAKQKGGGDTKSPLNFDWENAMKVVFGIADISQILQVLRGMIETLNDGKGIFHNSAKCRTLINFSHRIEPTLCYLLEIIKDEKQGSSQSSQFAFSCDEAFALSLALEQSMIFLAFGNPPGAMN